MGKLGNIIRKKKYYFEKLMMRSMILSQKCQKSRRLHNFSRVSLVQSLPATISFFLEYFSFASSIIRTFNCSQMGSILSEIMISIIDSMAIREMLGLVILIDWEMHLNHWGSCVIFFLSKRNFCILTRLYDASLYTLLDLKCSNSPLSLEQNVKNFSELSSK